MASSFSAARDFARDFRGGSRMASAAFQDDLTPKPFQPGEVSRGAAVVKFAQLFLTESARRRREKLATAMAAQKLQQADLTLQKLQREADPNYMNPYQRESLRLQGARDATSATNTTTDNARQSAAALETKRVNDAQIAQQKANEAGRASRAQAVDTRVRAAAAEQKERRSRVAQLNASQANLDDSAKRSLEAAEATAHTTFEGLLKAARSGTKIEKAAALSNLGISKSGLNDDKMIEQLRKAWVIKHSGNASARFERENAGQRAVLKRRFDEEAELDLEFAVQKAIHGEDNDPLEVR